MSIIEWLEDLSSKLTDLHSRIEEQCGEVARLRKALDQEARAHIKTQDRLAESQQLVERLTAQIEPCDAEEELLLYRERYLLKLERVHAWLKYEANSEGGLAYEIEGFIKEAREDEED